MLLIVSLKPAERGAEVVQRAVEDAKGLFQVVQRFAEAGQQCVQLLDRDVRVERGLPSAS